MDFGVLGRFEQVVYVVSLSSDYSLKIPHLVLMQRANMEWQNAVDENLESATPDCIKGPDSRGSNVALPVETVIFT